MLFLQQTSLPRLVLALAMWGLAGLIGLGTAPVAAEPPRLVDERLELSLFAEDPEIVTPIGMVVDNAGRVLVVESHTHLRPHDYAGPEDDRIKCFVDTDADGRADKVTVFADGLREAMNLALSPAGDLYVVCAREVVRLFDEDDDGRCERQETIVRLETSERYPHNCLLSLTFDRDGWLYIGRGNTASKFHRLVGSDGTSVAGYGDGGDVTRCRPDGSDLSLWATGFWNPFDLTVDHHGRLLLVDNDPDARGPNRLVHVVAGGDYGYRSLYGGSGNHPFQGWDGSLPGTLPMIAGTGEAPSGVLDCRRSSLPSDYADSVLVTAWNENSVERFELRPQGVSVTSERQPWMTGDADFRPVALDCDPAGNVYLTDWVLVDYPNHGRGRIWKISAAAAGTRKDRDEGNDALTRRPAASSQAASSQARPTAEADRSAKRLDPLGRFDVEPTPDDAWESFKRLLTSDDRQAISAAMSSADPFLRHAAVMRLADSSFAALRRRTASDAGSRRRLTSLLAMRRAGDVQPNLIHDFLRDASPEVRQAALHWIGDQRLVEFRQAVDAAIENGPVDGVLFEAYLAAVECLSPEFVHGYRQRATERAKDLPRKLDPDRIAEIAWDRSRPAVVRALALNRLSDSELAARLDRLLPQIDRGPVPWQLAAIAAAARAGGATAERADSGQGGSRSTTGFAGDVAAALLRLATDIHRPSQVRCEALLWLGNRGGCQPKDLLPLLGDADREVVYEAVRTLRRLAPQEQSVREALRQLLEGRAEDQPSRAVLEQLASLGLLRDDIAPPSRPTDSDGWQRWAAQGGDPERGRKVFLSSSSRCSQCHTVDGTANLLGPDLRGVAQSLRREQIIAAILDPSATFPPQYQAWGVVTVDGRLHIGLQLDHKAGGRIEMILDDGKTARFEADEIERYDALPQSLMPTGLAELMTASEFRDLVAFLNSPR